MRSVVLVILAFSSVLTLSSCGKGTDRATISKGDDVPDQPKPQPKPTVEGSCYYTNWGYCIDFHGIVPVHCGGIIIPSDEACPVKDEIATCGYHPEDAPSAWLNVHFHRDGNHQMENVRKLCRDMKGELVTK